MSDETTSEQLRRESDEPAGKRSKLIQHAATLKEQAAELQKQIARLDRRVKTEESLAPTISTLPRRDNATIPVLTLKPNLSKVYPWAFPD